MKVLILTDRMGTGGAETHIALLARGLARMGVEVTVLSGGGRIADELEREGIRQIRFPVSACNPWLCLKLRRILKRLAQREGYDLFHAHARLPACLMRGLNRYGVAEIATVHAHFSVSPLLRRVCHWGSYTIAVSE